MSITCDCCELDYPEKPERILDRTWVVEARCKSSGDAIHYALCEDCMDEIIAFIATRYKDAEDYILEDENE